ncbi:MAG TPA: ArsI/CadI family heavy metal resistance metalloenzyme [Pirellulales bacterium]
MPTVTETSLAKSHMSLNVSDLSAAVDFYRVLFGVAPCKCHDDYAKFELDSPPLVFSLQPGARPPGASLSHVGLRFTSHDSVLTMQNRLSAAGISYSRQDGVVCGYARQSKCWVADPDGNFWELYVLESDVDPTRARACLTDLVPTAADTPLAATVEAPLAATATSPDCCAGEVGDSDHRHHVMYRGPFREAADQLGRHYRRGERTAVSEQAFHALRRGPLAEYFMFAAPGAIGSCGGDNQ